MSPFAARLLSPNAPHLPPLIQVSHDVRVCAEYANPANTAVVYVPQWSPQVAQIFNRLSDCKVQPDNVFAKKVNFRKPESAHAQQRARQFLLEHTYDWLMPVMQDKPSSERYDVIHEVVDRKMEFIDAIKRHGAGRAGEVESECSLLRPPQGDSHHFNAAQPKGCLAHTDGYDIGIFAKPVGTVLVDQHELDIAALCQLAPSRKTHLLPLTHLANRLWQVPCGSFALWRGEPSPNAQFHFFPYVAKDTRRYRMFVHA